MSIHVSENEEDRKIFMPLRTARKVAPQRDYILLIINAKTDRIKDALLDTESVLRQRRQVKFGVLPARKASKLDPIECLRYE